MDETYYVGIKEPVELRKKILETSRNVLKNLQIYEEISELRTERLKTQNLLIDEIKDLKGIINKLKRALPKVEMKNHKLAHSSLNQKIKRKPAELTELESELSAVESALGNVR